MVSDDFLEDINNMLNTGEVPNLFPLDEVDHIIGDMRPIMKELELIDTRDACWKQFISRVRANLHIVLAMSPVGDNLRVWCRRAQDPRAHPTIGPALDNVQRLEPAHHSPQVELVEEARAAAIEGVTLALE